MGYLRLFNLQLMASVASPYGCIRESLAMVKHTEHSVDIACLIPMRHWHEFHMPRDVQPNLKATVVLQLLKLLGYSPLAEDESATWLWAPFWHGYRLTWADESRLPTCSPLAVAEPAPLPGKDAICAMAGTQPAGKSKLAALAREKMHSGQEPSSEQSWLEPAEGELIRLEKNTSLVHLRYPSSGWANVELPADTAEAVGSLICTAIRDLRSRQQQGDGGHRQALPLGGPSIGDQNLLSLLADMEPFC